MIGKGVSGRFFNFIKEEQKVSKKNILAKVHFGILFSESSSLFDTERLTGAIRGRLGAPKPLKVDAPAQY